LIASDRLPYGRGSVRIKRMANGIQWRPLHRTR
jgi:hypothetical protein